ncbi:MAG: NUDIX domain-containing protein, partial [Lachnospiraceae bacterium]|nr:NUDIX domain-containing protein [Lachnospiraceae bacterium]
DNGQWCIPGGALEPCETYIEAVKREIREEVGINVLNPELLDCTRVRIESYIIPMTMWCIR